MDSRKRKGNILDENTSNKSHRTNTPYSFACLSTTTYEDMDNNDNNNDEVNNKQEIGDEKNRNNTVPITLIPPVLEQKPNCINCKQYFASIAGKCSWCHIGRDQLRLRQNAVLSQLILDNTIVDSLLTGPYVLTDEEFEPMYNIIRKMKGVDVKKFSVALSTLMKHRVRCLIEGPLTDRLWLSVTQANQLLHCIRNLSVGATEEDAKLFQHVIASRLIDARGIDRAYSIVDCLYTLDSWLDYPKASSILLRLRGPLVSYV